MGLLSDNNQTLRRFMQTFVVAPEGPVASSSMFTVLSSGTKMKSMVVLSQNLGSNLRKKQRSLRKDSRYLI